jgi:S-adenosylmethionine synthetase
LAFVPEAFLIENLPDPAARTFELVERKGLGHPDTICDALAEAASRALCRWYLDRFGFILHHNLDKVLLVTGSARPAFGGGSIDTPIEIYLAGRASMAYRGVTVPIGEIVVEACRGWLTNHLRYLDIARDVRFHVRIHPCRFRKCDS